MESSDQPLPMIDPGALWDSLPAEKQRALGIAALVIAHGWDREEVVAHTAAVTDAGSYDAHVHACDQAGLEALACAAADLMEPMCLIDLGAVGMRMCHSCGCTSDAACEGGCSWAAENLCTTCAPAKVASP